MSEFRPTPWQRAAIEARDGALLVSAGAGSGKTRVLTQRLMSYICDETRPADLDSFLVISFTRAAAGELRGRISTELAARLAKDPGNRRLRRQSALCQRAQIGTIHSFCAALLRENCHLLSLSPDFKIADEERMEAMKTAALERALEKRYDSPEDFPGFTELADTVGAGRDDGRLLKLVLELHAKMQCHARPEQWAREQVALLHAPATDASQTPWGREVLDWAKGLCDYWAGEFDRLMAEMRPVEKISAAYMDSFSVTAGELRELRRLLDIGWDRAAQGREIHFPRLGTLREPPDPELAQRLKARRDACKKAMPALEKALGASSETLLAELSLTAVAMEALLSLTLDFDAAFAKSKRDKALVDYSDLEHLTARLLTREDGSPTELARQLSRRYTEIMVDEYQDVSRVQDAIFRALSREGTNLFMVGDMKQSIYRFRLAEPEIFNEKYLSYADFDGAEPPAPRRVLLRENFRSRREIIDGANAVFSLCMSRALGDMDYDDAAALRTGAEYPGEGRRPRLTLLELPPSGDEETPEKAELEARYAAEEIGRLMSSGMTVGGAGEQRPLEYGDIAILLRSANAVGGIYRRVLAERGIPSSAMQSGGFFSSVEVSTLMSMLAVTDNPHQDIPLIAVLRSPAFGFSADELSAIRAADRKHDLYTALTAAAETQPRCRDFLALLASLRETAPDLSAAELTWELMERLDMLAICSAMEGGEQRRARLMELIELAESYEGTGYRGLHRFVLWLRRLAEKGQEPSAAAGTSAVQIMSIHRSKGLEFPVVLLCDTARQFNRQDSRETVLVHPELGLGPKLTDLERRVEYPTLARNAIRLRLERELLSEEMRLLYVAMTRARERLYISAAMKDPEKRLETLGAALRRPMPPEALRQAASMADWLITACLADGGEHLELERRPAVPEAPETPPPETEEEGHAAPDPAETAELERRLAYRYPHEAAVTLPSKVTATELKGREDGDEDAQSLEPRRDLGFALPDFGRGERPLTGAERGVATHLVLQYMDFSKAAEPGGVRGEIARLGAERFLSPRETEAVDAGAIERLFLSPLGRRILSADELLREFRFSLLWDAERVYPGAGDEELLMQGVVDCCIQEKGELTVIDYKTDRVRTPAEIADRAQHYRGQLAAYAEAMERILKKPVRQCVLYFLAVGEAVTVLEK